MAQMQIGQFVHTMPLPPGVQSKAHRHGIVKGIDIQPMLTQHRHVIFQILSDFQDSVVLQQSFQPCDGYISWDLIRLFGKHIRSAMSQWHIASLPRRNSQAKTNKSRSNRL